MQIKDDRLYYVGGVVRDEVLGIPSFDVDLCYEGNAILFAKEKGFNIVKENPDFGTVRVLYEDKEVDIASTRCEAYPEVAHLPVVSNLGCALKDDLKRRDFTINSLAKNTKTGEIIDYFNGLEDIKNKKIRVLHEKSFIDDPSRIIRALKFSVRLGFDLDEKTKKLQENYLDNVNYNQSYHRLKKELKETFNLNIFMAYKKFVEQKIYRLLGEDELPVTLNAVYEVVSVYKPQNTWLVYLGCYKLTNFDLTNEEQEIVTCYRKIKDILPETDYEIYSLFNGLPLESLLLYAVSVNRNVVDRFLNELYNLKINLNGNDLLSLGFSQGAIFKDVFSELLKFKIENPTITKEDEIRFVKERYKC